MARLNVFLQHAQYLSKRRGGQMSFEQYSYVVGLIFRHFPCNLLVWGAGQDTSLWRTVNRGGRTAFLEDTQKFINAVQQRIPEAELHVVTYKQSMEKHYDMLRNMTDANLLIQLPGDLNAVEWDIILVDAPSYKVSRMESIYTSNKLKNVLVGKGRVVHILVHDAERHMERVWCDTVLGKTGFILIEGYRLNGIYSHIRHYIFGADDVYEADEMKRLAKTLVDKVI
eukprot:CAMPEP_0196581914 /NCGR_PEP_ID=MMETSP1081-20130531/36441_1 /TAXON_ID=36882 /ORGANISM="Pyramimonas amylifera, Strain CCMP720" /LENGTH=225 /DNA_ID=CAMNT_0041902317 /DNA_START=483 /DNA_END=1160 /DNA_ORIENTATION=+